MIDPILKYGTKRQQEVMAEFLKTQSVNRTSKNLKIARSTVQEAIAALKKRAALAGYSPEHDMVHEVPAPYLVKGTSTLYNRDGNVSQQWVKTSIDHEVRHKAMMEYISACSVELDKAKRIDPPKIVDTDLCNLYVLTDCHVGMLSWAPETGEDWDLRIAEDTLVSALQHAVASSPRAQTAIIAQLGDFLHFDSLIPETPTSKNILDADGRYSKVIRVATRILRTVISDSLKKHAKIIVLMAEGNHDQASSVWLRHLFGLLYENEPRVEVIDSEYPYYCYQHGQTMLTFHHGHLSKNDNLPLLFAAKFPNVWGGTMKRYCHVGHWHHVLEKEHPGMKVIQHPTLATQDAYAARNGYLSERELNTITYHKHHGQVGRVTVTPEMLAA